MVDQQLPNDLKLFYLRQQEDFINRIPPETVVWRDRGKEEWGTTIGGMRIYVDLLDQYVGVININDVPGAWGLYRKNEVVRRE